MMGKKIFVSLFIFLHLTMAPPLFSQEIAYKDKDCCCLGTGAAESTYGAVTLSMAIWGVGLAVGIGVLSALFGSSSSSHSH